MTIEKTQIQNSCCGPSLLRTHPTSNQKIKAKKKRYRKYFVSTVQLYYSARLKKIIMQLFL